MLSHSFAFPFLDILEKENKQEVTEYYFRYSQITQLLIGFINQGKSRRKTQIVIQLIRIFIQVTQNMKRKAQHSRELKRISESLISSLQKDLKCL